MTEGVLVVDARGRVKMANDAVRRLLQIEETPIDRHYVELIRHPEVAKQIGRALEAGGSSQTEITLSTEPVRVCLASAAPYTEQVEPGVVIVLHDVSDYRRAVQIRQDFVANVSHELRTPLTAIRGADGRVEPTRRMLAARQRFLDIVARHTTRMERLVTDLLRLARLDAGQEVCCAWTRALRRQRSRASMAELDARAAGRSNCSFSPAVDPAAERLVVDQVKMHDVIKNLVENAAHYAPERSAIELAATAGDAGTSVVLRVSDRGPGIPDTDLGAGLRALLPGRAFQGSKSRRNRSRSGYRQAPRHACTMGPSKPLIVPAAGRCSR